MSSVTTSSPAITRCQTCGKEIPSGADSCPACGRNQGAGSPRMTLAITLFLIFAGFALTQYIVQRHRATEASLAKRWFHRGNEAMQVNLPSLAAEDYRTALTYDRENDEYRLRLAQALLAANRLNEARSHLESLWEEEPASGEVNLALARLHVRRGDSARAIRFYNNAINGVWEEQPRQQRIAARFELVRYLMQQHDLAQAQAELMALQADGPPDPSDQLLLGQKFLQVNDPKHAIEAYDTVLNNDSHNADAWLGKGLAALQLGDYPQAEQALATALERDPHLEQARQQLELVREILRIDPNLRGLSLADRTKRVAEAFRAALKRLTGCAAKQGYSLAGLESAKPGAKGSAAAPATSMEATTPAADDLQQIYTSGLQKQASATEAALRRNPDALEPTMQYVYDVEHTTASICPATELTDRALLTLAQHESETVK
ncbi:MAG: tetratricopeptide repeat protein [Candidatus Korobacteraceae bacterium]